MKSNKGVLGLVLFFVVVIIACIFAISNSYVKNRPYTPNASVKGNVSENDSMKVRESYNKEKMKEKFLEDANDIEQNISKKILDGSVVNDDTLNAEVTRINGILLTGDWTYINCEYKKYWMGTWSLDKNVSLKFKFKNKLIEPNWINDQDISKYIVKN